MLKFKKLIIVLESMTAYYQFHYVVQYYDEFVMVCVCM